MDAWLDYSIPGPVLLVAFATAGYAFWLILPWFVRVGLFVVWASFCLVGLAMATVGHYLQAVGVRLLDACSCYPRYLRSKQKEVNPQ